MRKVLTALLFSLPFFLNADIEKAKESDYTFNQDKMIVDCGEIFLVSPFDSQDGLTVYNFNGQRLWEVRFYAKILSIDVQPDVVLVFSKDRGGHSTFLTCINRINGRILWERP